MRCPRLSDLPLPPAGRAGWPWTEESPQLPDRMPDGSPWPLVSIVTPSYNQARFVEETIRSVLLQGYPNLEYIVIDGGSTDGSVKIIRKYDPWLAHWVSEPDCGQSHAINKGWQKATGTLLGWINSDDGYLPGAFLHFARSAKACPQSLLAGVVTEIDANGRPVSMVEPQGITFERFVQFWLGGISWHQPGVVFPAAPLRKVGELDEGLRYGFDYDLMCRLLRVAPAVTCLPEAVAYFRRHSTSKTVAKGTLFLPEYIAVSRRFWSDVPALNQREFSRAVSIALLRTGGRHLTRGDPQGFGFVTDAFKISRYHPTTHVASRFGYHLLRLVRSAFARWRRLGQHA